jgi:hypothetical protein
MGAEGQGAFAIALVAGECGLVHGALPQSEQ